MRVSVPVVLSACILLIYLSFLTSAYYWDAVMFSWQIESVHAHEMPFSVLFHPNHLLYSAFGYLLYAGSLALGYTGRAITLLQIWNALVAAFICYRFFGWVRQVAGSEPMAVCSTLFLAFGATWWHFATDGGSYMISIRMLLVAVLFAVAEKPRLLLAALCHVASMLFHELGVFGYFPILFAIQTTTRRAYYLMGTGSAVVAVYYLCYCGGGKVAPVC